MTAKKHGPASTGVRVLGVRLTLETDVVAALAFVISVMGAGWQLYEFLTSGPRTKLLPPDQVFLFRSSATDGEDRLHLVMNFSYVNSGPEGHDDVVLRESARLSVGGKDHEYGWDGFGKIEGDVDTLRFVAVSRSLPFAVPGRGAVTHQTSIVPWPVDCSANTGGACNPLANHVRWKHFIGHLRSMVQASTRAFVFRLSAQLADRPPVEAQCKIEVSKAIIDAIDLYGAYSPTCYPMGEKK